VELPTSTTALLIALAILPGVAGEKAYRLLVGVDWREDKWQRTLRLLIFSVVGLATYAVMAGWLNAPAPAYVLPTELARVTSGSIAALGLAFLGHVAAAAMVGAITGIASRGVARLMSRTAYSSAWDHFVNACVKQHWVTLGLQNGDVYLGYIDIADMSVAAAERDVILREPALFDTSVRRYRALEYQSMFIPGTLISSVAVISDTKLDKRITIAGEILFKTEGENNDEQQ
jgi:hypothetical protein